MTLFFETKKQFEEYDTNLNNTLTGETCYIEETQEHMVYIEKQWRKIEVNEKPQVTLYELNKSALRSMPIMTNFEEAEETINFYMNCCAKPHRYMLLCKEISYFTIFEDNSLGTSEFLTLGEAVITCIKEDLGDILTIVPVENNMGIEIWFKTSKDEIYCMYLFNCASLFVPFGGMNN
jgi:hypothetical protein